MNILLPVFIKMNLLSVCPCPIFRTGCGNWFRFESFHQYSTIRWKTVNAGNSFFENEGFFRVLRIKYGGKLESMFMEAYNEKVYAAKKIRVDLQRGIHLYKRNIL